MVVEQTEIFGVAGTALEIRGGHHRSLRRGDNIIRGNFLHHYARWFRTYRPGILWGGVGNLFEDNHIGFAPRKCSRFLCVFFRSSKQRLYRDKNPILVGISTEITKMINAAVEKLRKAG